MSTPIKAAPQLKGPPRPRLDGADPLRWAVVREVTVGPRQAVVRQGDVPRATHLLLDGIACRSRLLGNGRRQITALVVPGDLCDLDAAMCGRADCSVETLALCRLGEIPADHLRDPDGADLEVRRALWRQLLRDEAIAREWMVGMGRRTARERTAHLLCEFLHRMRGIGLAEGDSYGLDLTQTELADVLGLSTVHVNRTLQQFRQGGLIEYRGKVVHVVDHAALARIAGFDPAYLDLV